MNLAECVDVFEKGSHARHNKLVISNLSSQIHPAFAKKSDWSNVRCVSDLATIDSIRDALRRVMDRKGMKPTTLSLKVGKNRTLVKDLLEKNRDINIGTLTKLAGALDVPISDLLLAPRVPIVGKIGAGGEVIFEELGNEQGGEFETVVRPPGVSGDLIALMVEGSSMLPKYRDGDIIYVQRNHDGVLPEYIGEDCAVRLADGATYIKQLIFGNEEGKFTLISLNAPPIENVEVEWATPVVFIMPARSRQLYS